MVNQVVAVTFFFQSLTASSFFKHHFEGEDIPCLRELEHTKHDNNDYEHIQNVIFYKN